MLNEIELYLKEKRYVQNVTQHTLAFYKACLNAFLSIVGDLEAKELTTAHLTRFVTEYRLAGKTPECTDARIRGINPFLTWLFESGVTSSHLRIKRQKLRRKVLKTFTEPQVRAIISFKPKNWYDKRLHTLLLLLLDCGLRIDEALTLKRTGVDFENLLITVTGKGNKERIVPFSIELRKSLYRFLGTHHFDLVFPCKDGGRLLYNNVRREFTSLATKLGIDGFDGSFHCFRRCFATNYIRENGNPLKLQRMLGHTTLKMTNDYVKMMAEDLRDEQSRTSLLNRR
jgi:integrase/recombinase XerD